jgi:hypothetical protein
MLNNLITNIQKITRDGKESYFGKRWSAETALRKNVDRQDFTFEEMSKASPARQLNDHILTKLQQSPDSEKLRFVEKLTNDSLTFLAKRQGMRLQQLHQAALQNESMTALMGRIFARIESYSIELNAYLGCTDLHTVITRPAHVREVTRFSKSRQPIETVTYFRARVGTSSWSLVVRGREGKVEFFLLPVERVMGLSKSEQLYEPLATLSAVIVPEMDSVEWELDERPLTNMREQELCMQLFATLIQATRDQMEAEVQEAI